MSASESEYSEFLSYLILNLVLLLLYSLPSTYVLLKNRGMLDVPSQANILVYQMSFLTKTATWTLMVLIFD